MADKTSKKKSDYSKPPQGMYIRTDPEIDKGFSAKEAQVERQLQNQRKLMEKTFKSKEKILKGD